MEGKQQLNLFKIRDLRKKDQFKIDDAYLNGYARACGKYATLVYTSLCRHAEFDSQKAFPSQAKIGYEHNIPIKKVREGLKKLREYNIILIEQEREKGKFANYIYTLLDKSEWKRIDSLTIGQNRPMVNHGSKTTGGKWPTKDNKVLRITNNTSKEGNSASPVAKIRNFFIEECKKRKGIEPEMAFGKEGRLLKEKLKRYTMEQLIDLIDKFLNSNVGEKLGWTLSICLSAPVINQWLAGRLEKPKKPYFQGNPMRQIYGRWQVLVNGEWLEFAGSEKEIIYQ